MSDTTSPPSVHLHPLSPSSSMSSTDSAPQSEPTSDEQPDLGAFTTVLRAWTYLQPPPRIPVQIHSPTTSTTTTFQPDQSVVDSDFQSNSQAQPPSPSSFTRPLSSNVLHEESTLGSHAPPLSASFIRPPSGRVLQEESTLSSHALPSSSFTRPPSGSVLQEESTLSSHALPSSSFTRPPSSSVLQEESTVWNHAPIASYLYSETPSIELEDQKSMVSTDGGRTVEINSESSFDEQSSVVPSQPAYLDVAVPVLLESSSLLPQSDASALTSHLSTNRLPSSHTVSYSPNPSLLSYQIPASEDSDHDLPLVEQRTSSSLKSQRSSDAIFNSMTTPTSGPPLAIPALSVQQQQQQHRTVVIHPPTQTISDDASVSNLSLPPPAEPPLLPIPSNFISILNTQSYLPQKHPLSASLPQPQPPRSGMGTSTSSLIPRISDSGQGAIIVDDSSTPDQTPDSVLVDRKRGRDGGFKPVDDDHEEEVGEKKTRAYGYGSAFGFGRVQQEKHVSGYTSNYEGSQSSFRARKLYEIRGRSTRLEPQSEDNEDSNFNSDVAEHHQYDDDEDKNEEEGNNSPFPRYRRHSGEYHFQTHTSRYYGRTRTPPRDVSPTQPLSQLHSMGQTHTQLTSIQLQPRQQTYSHHTDLDSFPDPYPRPHARPYVQDRDIYSSRSSMSSVPSISSPSRSQVDPSPIQRDYVLIQPQTQLSVPVQSLSQQRQQSQPPSQAQTRYSSTATNLLPPFPVSISIPASTVSIPLSAVSLSVPPVSVPVSSSHSSLYLGLGAVTSEDHEGSLLLLSSNKRGSPSVSSSALLSKTTEKTSKPDKPRTGDKPGEPDNLEKVNGEYVDLEEDELVSISVSERSSSVGGGGVSGSGSSGLGVESGSGFRLVELGQPSSMVHQPLSMKQHQPLTKHPSQQRRQIELQLQQSNVQTRLHVESDSDGSEDRGGTTTVGAGASALVSELFSATTAAPSATISTSTTTGRQPHTLNPITHSIPNLSKLNLDPNSDSKSNPKFDPRTNDPPKHFHPHSYSHQLDSHYHSHYLYPGFHSDSHVTNMEDTTESDLDLDLDHDLDHDVVVPVTTVERVGGTRGDALLPSLGYLDEALTFIAEERARWSAAREAGGAGGSAGADVGLKGGEGKRTDDRKVPDHDMDTPKRKRRRKRRQQSQSQSLSNANPELPEAPPTLNASHTPDEDGEGPSTSTSSAKRKKARSSSWSPAKKKNGKNSKGKEKEEFLIAPSQLPLVSLRPSLLRPAILIRERDQPVTGDGGMVLLNSPVEPLSVKGQDSNKNDNDGGRKQANDSGAVEDVFGPINLPVKRSKKMGRKERERERVKKDLLIGRDVVIDKTTSRGRIVDEVAYEDVNECDDDEHDDENDNGEDDDLSVDDSSLNNLSILQPPQSRRDPRRRKKGKDTAHIHRMADIAGGGAYKSTPGSPKKRREFDDIPADQNGGGYESLSDVDVEGNAGGGIPNATLDGSIDKKQTPVKHRKGLVRVRSVPQLNAEEPTAYAAEETVMVTPSKSKSKRAKSVAVPSSSALAPALKDNGGGGVDMNQPQTKRSRLIALAKKLRQFFPEQRQELRRVIVRLEKNGIESGKGQKAFLTAHVLDTGGSAQLTAKSAPIPVPGVRKSKRNVHHRSGSESAITDIIDDSIEAGNVGHRDHMPQVEEEDEDLDPRGRPPKKGDVLIHIFIDHSNILIGLLSHLKRFPLSHAEPRGTRRGLFPTISAKATPTVSMSHVTTSALAFAAVKPTTARPLPKPNSTNGNGKVSTNTSSVPIAVSGDYHPRIPLPSFATVSRSLPSGSILNEYLAENDDGSRIEDKDVHSDSHEYHQGENVGQITSLAKTWKHKEKEKKSLKHLWHAALVLLLERGRSAIRRVVVTSSPLYQPMDGIERLGYELRVYVRVPDLGDGMDRDRRISGSLSGGSRSVQSSPANPTSGSVSGLPLPAKKNKRHMPNHVRCTSGSTSAESGGGGGGSGNASGGASNLHPYSGITNNTPPHGKIKYREQGVDELLQLKLHSALAATDDVPEGSTIVLATGDGNMGQFNEEGFLGPIRTALRRGWKVELYAWEDGLSRAWRREFGENTEWGRKGMFRVIGMEQFASSLVEVIDL